MNTKSKQNQKNQPSKTQRQGPKKQGQNSSVLQKPHEHERLETRMTD